MRRPWLIGGLALAAVAAAAAVAQNQSSNATEDNPAEAAPADEAAAPAPPPVAPGAMTPMAERVATLGILNKRNGLHREIKLKPGQGVRIGDLIVKLKACETTAPWEPEPWTGAFAQVIVLGSDDKWRKYFSGWLYKESPSLNVVEHPIYDVWTKACQMRHPEIGPDTLVLKGDPSRPSGRSSNAPNAAAPEPEEVAAAAPSNAADSIAR